MNSDDDEHPSDDEDELLEPEPRAEQATLYTPPPSPVAPYTPAVKQSATPVESKTETSIGKTLKSAVPKKKNIRTS